MATSLIGLGSNLGQRTTALDTALDMLDGHSQINVTACSSKLQTDPIGGPPDQGSFLNSVAELETNCSPQALLDQLQEIEKKMGRSQGLRWAARPVDLDILLYDDLVLRTPTLTIPHPRMSFRRFVLEPACEIAAHRIHPVCGWSLQELLQHIRNHLNYVALAGPHGAGKSELAQQVQEQLQQHHATQVDLITRQHEPQQADPSRDPFDIEIKLLGWQHQQLDSSRWSDFGHWVVSDFWFDQSLVNASVRLDAQQTAGYRQQWKIASRSVITPKLVVVLEVGAEQSGSILAEIPYHGPLLRLMLTSDTEKEQAIQEVVAAVQAMQ
ncbi:MAG: 2-amino-4-hydroxy-6-hydroxymethyldihydropteridine diphosphokinase [Planctomycetales bacterium]